MDIEQLKVQMQQHLSATKAIAQKVEDEGRNFTSEERQKVEAHLAEIKLLQKQIDAADPEAKRRKERERDEAVAKQLDEMFGGLTGHSTPDGKYILSWRGAKGRNIRNSGPWGEQFIKGLGHYGRKELFPPSGSVTVGRLSSTIGTLDDDSDRPVTILQLFPVNGLSGDSFSYLRETTRQHAAAPVAIGERKPESIYGLERVDDRPKTIAHLSEPIPRQHLMDAPLLQDYLDSVLRAGLQIELENQILNGNGEGENLTGILNTANVNAQPFDTDILTTTRKAITALERLPVRPSAWAMNPVDWETFELLQDGENRYYWGAPQASPVSTSQRRLWSLPVVLSLGVPEGTAILADWMTAVSLMEREQAVVTWSEAFQMPTTTYDENPGTGFQHNMVQFRAENRYGLAVHRPRAIIEVDLTEGS